VTSTRHARKGNGMRGYHWAPRPFSRRGNRPIKGSLFRSDVTMYD
jgi:hypothetical protein